VPRAVCAIARRVSKVDDGVPGHETASQRLASLQAMSLATERRDTASPLDLARYKVWSIERLE
jgi:hypothetical protein